MNRIYLDHSATTPMLPEVREAMLPYLGETFGNPSSPHWFGQEARRAVERARGKVAGVLGALPEEIFFTSGGTESNNWALLGSARVQAERDPGRNHLITSEIEHHAILHTAAELGRRGYDIECLGVDENGLIDPDTLEELVRPETFLVSIMLVNNEVGTIQPVADIARRVREKNDQIVIHTDAVQAVGKIPVSLRELPADLLSISAHKFYGPKGVGLLFVRQGTRMPSSFFGGGQEKNRRAGTENVAGIVGMARALEISVRDLEEVNARIRGLQGRLEDGLRNKIPDMRINGHPEKRVPGVTNVSIPGVEGESVVLNLDLRGIAASAGSACTSGSVEPSHVLHAMGITPELARGSVRFSLGRGNTAEEMDLAAGALVEIVDTLRSMSVPD